MKIQVRNMIPNVISSRVGRSILVGKKNSPAILFGVGLAGFVTTVVMASRASLQLDETLEETKKNMQKAHKLHDRNHPSYSEQDFQKDVTILYVRGVVSIAKLYGPTLAVGALSVAALTGSHHILSQRNVALMSAYSVLDKSFSEYRKRVSDEYGEERDRGFLVDNKEQPAVSSVEERKAADIMRKNPNTPSGYARFFDELCADWQRQPEYNLLFLKCKQQYCNDILQSRGHLFLNEVYDMLGIERSSMGAVVGWVIGTEGDNYVDFGIFNGSNPRARDFVNGREGAILLDFNVDGVIYDKI